MADLVGDDESQTHRALAQQFLESPSLRRLRITDDPSERAAAGELLIVTGSPRVVASSWSEQTYGAAESITQISTALPLGILEGDLLVAFVTHAVTGGNTVSTPSGWVVTHAASGPGVESTAMNSMRVLTKTATAADAGGRLTVTQSVPGRMTLVMLAVRSMSGAVAIESIADAAYSAPEDSRGPHPVGAVAAPGPGRLAVAGGVCALAKTGFTTTAEFTSEGGHWTQVTPRTDSGVADHRRMRAWAGFRALGAGESTFGDHVLHGAVRHDGTSICLLLVAA